ncbi:hypothetical protein [Bradyrhizobium guangxiense]|uniref:hypothetical protein n=1 Tax=Bradyrhizobium guangxiense TaxID=1325115 RepID=UPI001008E730|nr:hypothetical protein [Bradyrhizobium guangxiense]
MAALQERAPEQHDIGRIRDGGRRLFKRCERVGPVAVPQDEVERGPHDLLALDHEHNWSRARRLGIRCDLHEHLDAF